MTTTIADRLQRAEAAFLALVELGEAQGHPFRGNQYAGGSGNDHQPMGGIQGDEQLQDGIWREQLEHDRPETDVEKRARAQREAEWEHAHPPTEEEQRAVVDAVTSSVIELGEGAGHPFRGNQHTGGLGDGVPHSANRELKQKIGDITLMRDHPIEQLASLRHEYITSHGGDARDFDYAHISRSDAVTRELGDDYKNAPRVDDSPETRAAYEAFREQTGEQWKLLTSEPPDGAGIRVDVMKDDPYPEPGTEGFDHMMADLNEGHMGVLEITGKDGEQAHPFLSNQEYTQFRAVHDAFGHAASGRGFDRHGEEAAWVGHKSMYTGGADAALTTETRGQNAYLTSQHEFPPYKMALLPEKFDDATTTNVAAAAAPMVQWGSKYEHVCCSGGHINVPVTYRPDTGRTGRETLMASSWIEFDADGDLHIIELGDSPGHPFRGNQYQAGNFERGDTWRERGETIRSGKPTMGGAEVYLHQPKTGDSLYIGRVDQPNAGESKGTGHLAGEHGRDAPSWKSRDVSGDSLDETTRKLADKYDELANPHAAITAAGNPAALEKWFEDGAGGKISWGQPGDFMDCVDEASKHMDDAEAKGFCQNRHIAATGEAAGKGAHEHGTLEERVIALEACLVAVFGDAPGHPFRGNQYSGGGGSDKRSREERAADNYVARDMKAAGIPEMDAAAEALKAGNPTAEHIGLIRDQASDVRSFPGSTGYQSAMSSPSELQQTDPEMTKAEARSQAEITDKAAAHYDSVIERYLK